MNEQQLAAVEARGEVFVSAGAGTGKTSVLVERFVRAVCDDGLDVDSVLVITYTRKAAGELRARIRAALVERGRARPRARARRRVDLDDPRLLRAAAARASVRGRDRPALPRARRGARRGDPRRGVRARARDVLRRRRSRERLRLLATYGSGAAAADAHRRLRDAALGRAAARARARRAARPRRAARRRCARRRSASLDDPARPTEPARGRARRARPPGAARAAARPRRARARAAPRAATLRGGAQARSSRPRSRSLADARQGAAPGAARPVRRRVRGGEGARVGARLRGPPAPRARPARATTSAIREAEQLRFRTIMVDEFQDTNALQCELIDLLARRAAAKDVFFVGDEFQSIYGFRHADVDVFRERRAAASQRLPLTRELPLAARGARGREPPLRPEFGDGFQPLAASGEFPDPVFGHPVELLVTDKASYREARRALAAGRGAARRAARARARRRGRGRRPARSCSCSPPAPTPSAYEEELRALGLPTYRATGRRYFGQQQVVDLLMYLRLLRNRYDDEALVGRARLAVRRRLERRARADPPPRRPAAALHRDRALAAAGARRARTSGSSARSSSATSGSSRASARVSLERLCEQVVCEHDYDLAVLARWDGKRRYANLRKLMRLARSYEELRGRDIEGFVRFIRDQEALGAAQLEAVSEEEGADAVRLLTIHAREGARVQGRRRRRRGPRHRRPAGAPTRSSRSPTAASASRSSTRRPGERRRSSATRRSARAGAGGRARRAAAPLLRRDDARDRPADRLRARSTRAAKTPIGWVLSRLECEAELAAARGAVRARARRRARSSSASTGTRRPPPRSRAEDEPADGDGQLALFARAAVTAPPRGYRLPELAPVAAAAAPPRAAALVLGARALRALLVPLLRRARRRAARAARAAAGGGDGGLAATEIGDAVHRLLELVDLARPAPARRSTSVRDVVPGGDRRGARADRRVRRARTATRSSRGASPALAGARPERPFAFEHDGVLLHGRLDVLHRDGAARARRRLQDERARRAHAGGDRRGRLPPPAARVRARVLPRRRGGGRGRLRVPRGGRRGRLDDVPRGTRRRRSRRELSEAIARINAGEFVPTPSEFTCAGCPALDVVCAGPALAAPGEAGARALVEA